MKKHYLFAISILLLVGCDTRKEDVQRIVTDNELVQEFNGVLYVQHQNETLYLNKVSASKEKLEVPELSTPVHLASLTKLFTSIAVLKLKEKGLIDLDKNITDYRGGFRPSFGNKITIRNLLAMKSGLPRELNADASKSLVRYDNNGYASSFLDTIPEIELLYEPGEKQSYSNLSYWLLGAVIEEVNNTTLNEAFQELIFKPLDMVNSGLDEEKRTSLIGYYSKKNTHFPDEQSYKHRYSSGGAFSSIEDLVKLSEALKGSQFLSDNSKQILTKGKNKIAIYGSLHSFTNVYVQDFKSDFVLISLNNVGFTNLDKILVFQHRIEEALGVTSSRRKKKKVRLAAMEALQDSIPLEKGIKLWAEALQSGNKEKIFNIINLYASEGSMSSDDATWSELSKLNLLLPDFEVKGFRWVRDQQPKGIEVWCANDVVGTLALRWIPSESDTNKVANLFIMPDDMEWMGKKY